MNAKEKRNEKSWAKFAGIIYIIVAIILTGVYVAADPISHFSGLDIRNMFTAIGLGVTIFGVGLTMLIYGSQIK